MSRRSGLGRADGGEAAPVLPAGHRPEGDRHSDQRDRDDPFGRAVVAVRIPARHLEPVMPEERKDTEDAAEGCERRLDLVETTSVFQHHSPLFGLQESSENRRIGEPL